MVEEELNKINEEINDYEDINPYKLDINIIDNQSGKIMNLIREVEDFSYPLKNQYYSFKFNEPLYIHEVSFSTEYNVSIKGMEINYVDYNDNSSTMTFSKKENTTWAPKKVIKEFKIKPPSGIFKSKIKLTNINMFGFKLTDLNTIKDKLTEVSDIQSSLQSLSQSIESRDRELEQTLITKNETINNKQDNIDFLNNNIKDLENEISKLTDSKSSLEEDTNQLIVKKESLTTENTNLKNNTQQLKETSSQLNTKISTQEAELKKLVEDTNIFSTEVKEYIEQGNKDIKLYTRLSVIPWILIVVVTLAIFNGSADLSTIYNPLLADSEEIDIVAVFWSRLPFALITISILFVSFEISKMFIKNIIHIQKQRRIFTKIGIIAKDVADSSIKDLDIDEKDKFELRTKLKMDLLKNHLKNEIGEDYEHDVKISLLEHLAKLKKNKNESKEDKTNENTKNEDS